MTTTDELRQLVEALRASLAPPGRAMLEETHISVVILAGDRAHKLKKPLDLGFLDFSTPEKRRAACEDEVRLNRRLAPSWYLGVAPVFRTADGAARMGEPREPGEADPPPRADERVVEHAVVMRRLPEAGMLGRVLDENTTAPETLRAAIERIGADVARFHASCPTGPGVDEHAEPDAVRERIGRNLDEATAKGAGADGPLSRDLIECVRAFAGSFIGRHRDTMRERVRDGRAREGHGDLHTGNICLTPEGPVVFDCIEFSKRLRCMDAAAELAFFAMDLARRGRADLGEALLDSYARHAGEDTTLRVLQPLYCAHFACVRAKVTAIKALSSAEGTDERAGGFEAAQRWLAHACSYALAPAMVLTCGLPASGKSHSARLLAKALRADLVQSDVVRKLLAGLRPEDRSGAGDDEGVYSEAFTRRTYDAMLTRARDAMRAGRSVVVDATFQTRDRRAPFLDAAQEQGRPACVLWRDIDDDTARARLEARAHDRREPSDADWRVYELLKPVFEAPTRKEAPIVRAGPDVSAHEALMLVCGALAVSGAT